MKSGEPSSRRNAISVLAVLSQSGCARGVGRKSVLSYVAALTGADD